MERRHPPLPNYECPTVGEMNYLKNRIRLFCWTNCGPAKVGHHKDCAIYLWEMDHRPGTNITLADIQRLRKEPGVSYED